MRDTLSSGFIRAARARGLSNATLVGRYLLPNALAPFVTWTGFSLPLLINGIFVVEWVYRGKIIEHGSSEEVLRKPREPYTRALLDAARYFQDAVPRIQT